jgi:hypothetical protein
LEFGRTPGNGGLVDAAFPGNLQLRHPAEVMMQGFGCFDMGNLGRQFTDLFREEASHRLVKSNKNGAVVHAVYAVYAVKGGI